MLNILPSRFANLCLCNLVFEFFQQFGGTKGVTKDRVGPQQEKNIWLTLIDHLKRKDKLPVVAFTLSRNRCDTNATMLTSLDLTTGKVIIDKSCGEVSLYWSYTQIKIFLANKK